MRVHRIIAAPLLGLLTFLAVTPSSHAETAYVTGGSFIYRWDTATNTVTPVVSSADGGGIDSLIFDGQAENIIYSIIGTSSIGIYNLNTGSNRILARGGNFTGVADMALEPGGATFLVSNAFDGSIDRVNIATGAVSTLYNGGLRPDGVTYDNSGHLFAVLNLNEVAQLDPTTGAVLKTIATPNQPDGLTFDELTGKLYVSSDGGGFYTLPTDLSSAPFTPVSGSPVFDGMASNGNLLYFVVRDQGALIYDLNTGAITIRSPSIPGADDIAPLTGLGSPVPEPSPIVLLSAGLAILAVGARRRKATTAQLSAETRSVT
jgi:hypothetical protein